MKMTSPDGYRHNLRGNALWCLIVAAFTLSIVTSAGRKPVIRELAVPEVADVREPATLWCRFELGGARLYSVKWYKDEQEFFRFMPDEQPPAQTFPVPFVTLDESGSGEQQVTLVEMSLNSSGCYRCEVSVEAPSFDTTHHSANMTVMALPREAPRVAGVAGAYSVGEWVAANCTSAESNPPAALSWYINGAKAEQWLLDQMPTAEEGFGTSLSVASLGVEAWLRTRAPRTGSVDARGLHTSSLGLRFVAERRFFQGSPPRIELRCEAAVGDRTWDREVAARLATASIQQLRSDARGLASAHMVTASPGVLFPLLLCSMLRLMVS